MLKKVLLIRFSSIGDIVLTSPVIRALKQQGSFEVHCLTKKQYAPIYQSNPNINKVYIFDNNLPKVIKLLQKEGYFFVVDLQKNMRSLRVKWMLQKPDASFPKLNKEKWILVNFKINKLPHIHIVDRYFEAVKKLDVKNDGKGLDFFVPENDRVNILTIDERLKNGYIGFVIGGQHFTKMLPVEKIVSVIKKIDYPVVLLGGENDHEKGNLIVRQCQGKIVLNTCGKYSLMSSASLVQQAKAIITNDTGLMHIAAAFNKFIISIWGNTVPAFGMTPYEPENPNNVLLSEVKFLPCRPCSKLGYKKCPKKHFRCMLEQDEDYIVTELDKRLKIR